MRAIGIILAGGNNNRMRELSNKRAIAAMPIAGSYRSIDFALSNMASSHIQRVAVLTQYNARSLNEHLSSSKWWDFGRKQGGLFVFTPTITKENSLWYQGTADAIYQNLEFLKSSHEPYVVIASGDCVYKMDYNHKIKWNLAYTELLAARLAYEAAEKKDLHRIAKDYPSLPTIAVDGVYGESTANAVRKFQNVFGLPQTGIVDYPTWYKISEIYVGVSRIAELN